AVTYAAIGPALAEQCGTCHGAAATKGLRVTDYESLLAGGESGPVIVPGSPDESLILTVLKGGHFARLSDEQMALLEAWIAAGAPPGEASAPVEEPVSATATPEDDEG
ncbi:MAG: c-type cytochrome domain-containing protein, partial [Planctomycetota bacterium]